MSRIQQPPKGDDGHPRGPGEGRQQRTNCKGHDRQTARKPTQQLFREPHQTPRGVAVGEEEAGKGEQRYRRQHRGVGEPVHLDEENGEIELAGGESGQGQRRDDDEQRGAEGGEQDRCEGGHGPSSNDFVAEKLSAPLYPETEGEDGEGHREDELKHPGWNSEVPCGAKGPFVVDETHGEVAEKEADAA